MLERGCVDCGRQKEDRHCFTCEPCVVKRVERAKSAARGQLQEEHSYVIDYDTVDGDRQKVVHAASAKRAARLIENTAPGFVMLTRVARIVRTEEWETL